MNRIFLILTFCSLTILTSAQVRRIADRENFASGDLELGISSNTGVYDKETNGGNDFVGYYNYNQGREFYFSLNAYGGYYFLDGLSFGPEIGIDLSNDGAIYIIGNLSYTFNSSSRSFYPYVKAGYGVTDVSNHSGDGKGLFGSLNYSLLNFGLGVKILQSSNFALIIEVNYKNIKGSDSVEQYYPEPYSMTYDTKIEILTFSFGSALAL